MKKSTRYNALIALTYSLTLVGGMFLGYKFLREQGYRVDAPIQYAQQKDRKVEDILHIIHKKYVDDVSADSLQNLPIDSLLDKLDPHSIYLPPTNVAQLSESLEGNFEGIGVEYYILNDTLLVTNVLKDGPAFLGGLKQGDRIVRIDSNVVSGRSLPRSEMIGKIKGKKGTTVQLLVTRPGMPVPTILSIKRGRVDVSSIDAAYMLNTETAYVRISKFGANTDKDFINIIKGLKQKGMRNLVLDLRDNGGGYVTAATGLANQFFPENKLIVYTEGKHEPRTDYYTTGGGEFEQGRLAVLINEYSASASEIFAGAIQDLDRGLIIGRRSFGKGLVQEQFPFEDGSALNLTVARYYTPLGRSIQKAYKRGPKGTTAQEISFPEDEEVLNAAEAKKRDSVLKITPFITASGKKVYGGGGIKPDVFVKYDTTGYTKLYATLREKKLLIDFVFDVLTERYGAVYLSKNLGSFSISDVDFKDFVQYVQSKNVKVDPKQLAASRELIYNDLKLMLCKYHLGDMGYYKANNLTDPVVKQALLSIQ